MSIGEAVAIRDVVFRWRPDHAPCLDLPEFGIGSGERVFLHGPSGSGKSTLLSLIGGVIRPERGSVTVLGTRSGALPPPRATASAPSTSDFIFQLFNLIPYLSALENILLPCRFAPGRRAISGRRTARQRRRRSGWRDASVWTTRCWHARRSSCPSASSSGSRQHGR